MEFFLVFAFGLIAGSFLNVVIYRLNPALKLKGGVFGRSFCPECKHQLKWYDLVPLLSFVWLRGCCRYCRKKISWQYPVIEGLSVFIWIGVFYKVYEANFSIFGGFLAEGQFLNPLNPLNLLNFFYYILIFSALLIIAVYDFKWRIIPDKIIYPAIATALIFNFFKSLNIEIFIYLLFTASVAFLFFFAIFYFSHGKAMGFGDAKLAFLIGLFLSPLLAVLAFITAFVTGAVFGIILIWFGNKTFKSQIAFGPFLVLGVFLAFFFSNFIINFLIF